MESRPRAGKEMRGDAWDKMQSATAKECLNRLAAL